MTPVSGSVRFGIAILLLALSPACGQQRSSVEPLGKLAARLSEAGEYFDTDNLISNERSFVRVVDKLHPVGGVYIGVGPEQNFTYIARTRPEWVFIVDVRRDNMVQHLLLNSVLAISKTPESYLRNLLSLEPSETEDGAEDLDAVLVRLSREVPKNERFEANLRSFDRRLSLLGFDLTDADRAHLRSVYSEFFEQQLGLRFRSHGRGFSNRYPSYRELISARTEAGDYAGFLGRPDDYRFVRSLVLGNRLVPVVGNFAGESALTKVGDFAREKELEVTTFYTSNVEYYLMREGSFGRFAENVAALPLAEDGLFVRAYFDYGQGHPQRLPGHRSATVLQRLEDFVEMQKSGRVSYWALCTEKLWGETP